MPNSHKDKTDDDHSRAIMNEIFLDGVKYILAADAGKHAGLTRDYVTRLCREGKVAGTQAGKNWYVSQEALDSFILMKEREQISRSEELAHQLAQEYRAAHGLPALPTGQAGGRHGLPNSVAKNIVSLNVPSATASGSPDGTFRGEHSAKQNAVAAPHRPSQAIHHALHPAHGLSSIVATAETSTHSEARMQSSGLLPEISPVEFAHKLTALAVVALLAIGTYAMVEARFAHFARETMQNAALTTVSGLPSSEPPALPTSGPSALQPGTDRPSSGAGTAYYLSKAGEGISTGISSAISSASENLTLAGSALATEIGDSIIATAEAGKRKTIEVISKTRNTILAEAESIKTETVTLAVNTKDAIVAGAESVKQSVITYATNTRGGAVELKNISLEAGHSLIRHLTRTGDSILAYAASMSTLAAATPQANQQISWLGPQRTHDTPTAFESIAGKGLAFLKENTLLDSVVGSFSTQLAAATLALPRFSLTADIFSPSRNPVFHAFTHATARPVFASNNQPLPEPQPNTLVPARTLAQAPAKKLAQASPKADASVGSPTSSSVGAVTLTQSTPSATPQHIASLGTVFEDILALRLQELENKLASRIAALSASTNMQATQTYQVIAQTNKIDRLSSVSISGSTITGSSFAGSSMTADSSSLGNATSTALFSTTASSTNLYSTTFTLGTGTLGSSTSTNSYSSTLTAGNATTTNLFSTTASSTNLFSQTATLGSTSISSALTVNGTFSVAGAFSQSDLATFASGFLSNSSSTITSGLFSMNGGASTTNFTASGTGYFTTATSTNLFSTSATFGVLSANSAALTSATTTNLFSSIASSTNLFSQAASVGTLAASGATTLSSTLGVTGLSTLANLSLTAGTTTNFFSTAASSTNLFSQLATIGTLTLGNALAISNGGTATTTQVTNGVNYFDGTRITSGTALTYDGTKLTAPFASSTALSVSGVGYFGTASTTNLTVSSLTLNRVPYITTAGAVTDSANLTFDGTTLTAANLTSSGNVSLGYATTTNLFSTTASSTNLYAQAASVGTLAAGGATTLSSTLGVTGLTTLGNLSLTAGTTTNFFSTTASSTNLFSQLATLGTLTLGNALAVTSGGTGVTTSTGTGSVVLSASPTLSGTIAGASQTLSGTLGVTGLTTLGQASTTLFSSYGPAYFGATATSSFSSAGVLTLTGITNSLLAVNGSGVVGATTTPTAQYFIATSTSIASTFPYASSTALTVSGTSYLTGITSTGATTLTNATTTNLFSTTASSTNLYAQAASVGTLAASGAATLSSTLGVTGLGTLASGFLSNASSTITSGLFTMSGGASTTNLTASGTGYFGLGQFTNTSGTTTIASGQGFTVGSSQLVVQQGSGNVGLGTTAPGGKTEIVSGTNAWPETSGSTIGGAIALRLGGSNNGIVDFGLNGGSGAWIQARDRTTYANNYVLALNPNGGNVGIGTTTPGQKLEVNSANSIDGIKITSLNRASIWFYGTQTAGSRNWLMQNEVSAVGDFQILRSSATGGVPDTNVMTFNSSGNVGIGTTAPAQPLHIVSSVDTGFKLARNIGTSAISQVMSNTGGNLYIGIDTSAGGSFVTGAYARFIYSDGAYPLVFVTNAAEAMRITSTGNVGIGTASPTAGKLSIYNAVDPGTTPAALDIVTPGTSAGTATDQYGIKVTANSYNNSTAMYGIYSYAHQNTNLTSYGVYGETGGSGTQNTYGVYGKGNQIDTNGAGISYGVYGIATSSGANGTGKTYAGYFDNQSATGATAVGLYVKSTTGATNNYSAIFEGGNVGIGTTGPAQKLDVAGSIAMTGSILINQAATGINNGNSASIGSNGILHLNRVSGAGLSHILFDNGGNQVGDITSNTTSTAYNTSSDRRLKENIAATTLGLSALLKISVSDFNFIRDPGSRVQGFIAQDLYNVYPEAVTTNGDNGIDVLDASSTPWRVDYGRLTPLVVRSVQELDLNLESIASSTVATSTPESQSFAERFFSNIFARITAWLADAANGVGEVFAKVFHAGEKICVNKSDGAEVCVTGDQLASLLAGAAAAGGGSDSSADSSDAGGDTSESAGSQQPVAGSPSTSTNEMTSQSAGSVPTISINGNNPATITVGDTFGDLGAIITGPTTADTNLGIYTFLDGVAMDTINLDTSTAGTHTIDYTATNSAGTATSTRTVIVKDRLQVTGVSGQESATTTTDVGALTTDTTATSTGETGGDTPLESGEPLTEQAATSTTP